MTEERTWLAGENIRRAGVTRRGFIGGSAAAAFAAGSGVHVANAAGGDFPASVDHAFGRTVVPRPPLRIVSAGFCDDDSLLALGCVPVAMVRRGMFESGIAPWCEPLLAGQNPVLLDGVTTDYETILGLEPDLIINVFSGMDALAYDRLSSIAPTIAYRSGPWRAGWREQTRQIGLALGRAEAAERLIDGTKASLSGFREQFPSLVGKSFTFGTYFAGSGSMVVYLPGETRVDWLVELGMRISPGVNALAQAHPGRSSLDVSLEQLEGVDADILVMWFEAGSREAIERQPLFRLFSPVRRGAYVALEDAVSVWSASWPSVLSIPYGFPRILPRLAQAAKISPER
ncbi:iron-siderophore ABC transporter substrate-binding protein [Sinorhizobium sp. BG8]|uniref:iron-siderophore ABC transporter substrate-binding protein n=1 Tax=Sinorhizobium sp. BG8 TaxID=2613773 RepID=UPI00193D9AC8|nr:iron-siderophore ABC transporter substrate-binding protein [Sinorhizobium sp. BG8]QRM56132.1 iron-siderophore ABC transporter substrate-binding protein [Sinorhizobium sp. BG8]